MVSAKSSSDLAYSLNLTSAVANVELIIIQEVASPTDLVADSGTLFSPIVTTLSYPIRRSYRIGTVNLSLDAATNLARRV